MLRNFHAIGLAFGSQRLSFVELKISNLALENPAIRPSPSIPSVGFGHSSMPTTMSGMLSNRSYCADRPLKRSKVFASPVDPRKDFQC